MNERASHYPSFKLRTQNSNSVSYIPYLESISVFSFLLHPLWPESPQQSIFSSTPAIADTSLLFSSRSASFLPSTIMASLLLEQQEKLRRAVDDWRLKSTSILSDLNAESLTSSSSCSDPIQSHIEPTDDSSDVLYLLDSDNAAVSKFITVLCHDCLEISHLCQLGKRNLYKRLQLFAHRLSSQQILLEGEPQKAFAQSLSLFIELYETVDGISSVLINLLLQLNVVYSVNERSVVRPLNSFKTFNFRAVFDSLGEGISVLLVLDEILRENHCIKNYLSLFARMLSKVKMEVETFNITLEEFDFIDQVIENLQKLFEIGFFQRLIQAEALKNIRNNKKLLEAFSFTFHENCSEILLRLNSFKELPTDRPKIFHFLALLLFSLNASGEIFDKKPLKLLTEIIKIIPLIYIEGKGIILFDMLKTQCSKVLSSWLFTIESSKDFDLIQRNYLTHINELHSRDWEVMKDSLSCWTVSFQSSIHPSSEIQSEEWLRLLLKQILQGVVLADRLYMLVISMLDLHASLEVPLRREKVKSVCHMIVSLKILGEIFHMKEPSIVRSLPHIINIIQSDIEQLILPLKVKLQNELSKGNQSSKLGFLNSLTRGSKEMDTKRIDSLSLVNMCLQILRGNGSIKRQIIFLINLDALESIGHLDIDFQRIRKLVSKLNIISNFHNIISEKINCGFLYWKKEMLQTWLSMVYLDNTKFTWIQYILDAFSDGLLLLKHCNVTDITLTSYEQEIETTLRTEIIDPLCRDIEADLRLHVHSTNLKGSVFVNPTKTGVRNLSWYTRMKPLRLPFKFIDIKLIVEKYLNFAFYSHTMMSNYDHKIYSEMRNLGEVKYGLELDDFHLIEYSFSQDFHILNIFENLDNFSENYFYNILNQVLIENDLEGERERKNLRVINAEHFSNFLSLHGLILISEKYSEFIIDFLNKMISNLHDLLQDDAQIDNLSLNNIAIEDQSGSHKIEQVKCVITKIGNILGLVKITYAGYSIYISNNSWFEKNSSNLSLSESCKKLGFSNEIISLGKIIDESQIKSYQNNIFKPLSFFISIISQKHQSGDLSKFKDFFKLVVYIVGNIIESRALNKDKLIKRDYEINSLHNHDGFIMGVVFLLKVLQQEREFDDLNWFDNERNKFEEKDCNKISEKNKSSGIISNSISSLMIWSQVPSVNTDISKDLDKNRKYQNELELIECSLKIARIIIS
ncbi:hypothetical protein LUZ60_012821 [Juncus effusus]|nr:hypothetical protein LUZ60_012821 [Juncus effusus]